jgi:undecaprenyl-diphosphatase
MSHPLLEAVILGIVQGITEFLPISSDGHLALTEILFGFRGGLVLNVMLHVGTLIATLVAFRKRVGTALVNGAPALLKPSRFKETEGGRDAWVVIMASIPTAIIGLLLRDAVERWTESPLAVGLGFLATSVILISTHFVRPGDAEHPSTLGAVLIGIAQGMAVLPGLSRSGSTISLALWLGVSPVRAFELSFLMSLPAVLGATLLELPKALRTPGLIAPASLGAFVALITGFFAIWALRRVVVHGRFSAFALWVLPVALATLAMARSWPQ